MQAKLTINHQVFIWYKFFNSIFFGIAVGSYVTQYEPLKIEDFPVIGIAFCLLSIPIALLYKRIMKIHYFYTASILVEVIMLIWIVLFLIDPWSSQNLLGNSYQIALIIYIARYITFMFGDFLSRAETIFIKKTKVLSKIDVMKQLGTISGMMISVFFYTILENYYGITENAPKVFYIHFLLCVIEVTIITLLILSFNTKNIITKKIPRD